MLHETVTVALKLGHLNDPESLTIIVGKISVELSYYDIHDRIPMHLYFILFYLYDILLVNILAGNPLSIA